MTKRCVIFVKPVSNRVTISEENSQVNSNNLKAFENSIQQNNLNNNSCLQRLENLKEGRFICKNIKKLSTTITNTIFCSSAADGTTVDPSNILLMNE